MEARLSRFDPSTHEGEACMLPSAYGDYVVYDDAPDVIEDLEQQVARLRKSLGMCRDIAVGALDE